MKYETKHCTVRDIHEGVSFDVLVALGSWDEVEDADDERIFFYMDGEPLAVGTIISEDFVVTHIKEK
jgi:hypothetical protein